MPSSEHIVVVGAGPAGLACATRLAEAGCKVILIEKKKTIGQKVCAGGITWNGQLSKLPADLIQRKFYAQRIVTPLQKFKLSSPTPILATVDRVELGQYMLKNALDAGVKVLEGCKVLTVAEDSVTCQSADSPALVLPYSILVGADGANSKVRRFLNLPVNRYGIGIHFQLPFVADEMQWHLSPAFFKNGYGWVFPHASTTSIGAYADKNTLTARALMANLKQWAERQGFDLTGGTAKAEMINYDYRGWNFGRIFLAGEASGIASALTGEGINAAVQTGEFVAEHILDPASDETSTLDNLIRKHRKHTELVAKTQKSTLAQRVLPEVLAAALRLKLVPYTSLEFTG